MSNKKNTTKKSKLTAKYWSLIIYPDSAPTNWQEIISEGYTQWACSPLHDKDINPTGEPKKAHYHVLIKWNGRKDYQTMLRLTGRLKAPNPQVCNSTLGMLRYFTHLDNPEKYQYDEKDIQTFNGYDINSILHPETKDKDRILTEIYTFIVDNAITEYWELVEYANQEQPNWLKVINTKTFAVDRFITSFRHSDSGKLILQEKKKQQELTLIEETNTSNKPPSVEEIEKTLLREIGLREYQESYECQYLC
ncbi:replication protein [Vagococcus zengguangii]|uniref:replication protein n=1 Tax=Vagococcus zengguangii TaxID=2571750 RepID=UPI001108435E|nr:replication protein [Vagococcus zengguangii]TLG78302.1 plasmid replication protein [Vagococcus zengguangii]